MSDASSANGQAPAGALRFIHDTLGQRVLFGSGLAADHLAAEVQRLGATRPLVIDGSNRPGLAETITRAIQPVGYFDGVVEHVPVSVAHEARQVAGEISVDLLVSIGGGSATGVAKSVAMTTGLPIVAVPTTYAGSEATDVWGLTDGGRKMTGVDPAVLPVSVVYDAELTLSLTREQSVASALNALAHCVDALWAPRADPINQAMAVEGARVLTAAIRAVAKDPQGLPGREQAQYACYIAAVAFASAGSGMHHKICHGLGGAFQLPHAPTHAVVLPHVLAFNQGRADGAVSRLAAALAVEDALAAIVDLMRAVDAPSALRDIGFHEEQLDEAADIVLPLIPPSNPRAVDRFDLLELLRRAWAGDSPIGAIG
jgi:maleylacetate reductase